MKRQARIAQRVIAVFLLGCLLFSFPLLALFNVPALAGGIPVLFVYIFGAWAGLIVLVALVMARRT